MTKEGTDHVVHLPLCNSKCDLLSINDATIL